MEKQRHKEQAFELSLFPHEKRIHLSWPVKLMNIYEMQTKRKYFIFNTPIAINQCCGGHLIG